MNPVWREVLLITLFNVAALCLAVGVFLSVAPRRFLAVTDRLNRWISTDAAFESLDRPRPADRYLYRRHLWVGAVLILGSMYIIYTFCIWYDRSIVLPALPIIYNRAASAWIYDSLLILFRGIGAVGLIAGVVVSVRPSLLKALEATANRWISTERWSTSLDQQKDLPPQWFPGRPRLFGVGITLGAGYMMWLCAQALWGGS